MLQVSKLGSHLSKQSFRTFKRSLPIFIGGVLFWNVQTGSTTLFAHAGKKATSPIGDQRQEGEVRQLEVGKPIERKIAGGETHSYQITLTADKYLSVVVEQRSTDVMVTLFGPDGKPILEVDTESLLYGREIVSQTVETPGSYRLDVKSNLDRVFAGRYEIRIVELRAVLEQDRTLQEAYKISIEASALNRVRKYDEARPLFERALEIYEKTLGTEHPRVALALNNLALLYRGKGDYANAESLYQRALAITEKALGLEHYEVAIVLYNLAGLYYRKGDYTKAEPLYQRALDIKEKIFGAEHLEVAGVLGSLGILCIDTGDYAKAELLDKRALAIFEKELGPEHHSVAAILLNLANVYKKTGDYAKSEPPYQRALAIWEKLFGPEHTNVALALNNLGLLYRLKGDYAKSESAHRRALAIWEKAFGPEHPMVAEAFNNLGIIYYVKGDYAKAEPLLQRALAIREKALGSEHLEVSRTLENLALVYHDKGDYTKAEPLYQRALDIGKKLLGPDHPEVALSLDNLGAFYSNMGDYAKAEPLLQRAASVREKLLGPNHPYLAISLNNLVKLYVAKNDAAQAITFQLRACTISEHNIALNLATGSERQKLAYLALLSDETDQIVSLHVNYASNNSVARSLASNVILQRKGRALDAMTDSFAAMRRRANLQDQILFDQLKEVSAQLSWLVLNGPLRVAPDEYQKRIKDLEEQKEKLEASISQRSAEFRTQSQPVTLEAVQAAIPADAALIEFASYRPFKAKYTKQDEQFGAPQYVAYILRQQGEVRWVDFGEASSINKTIDEWRKALRDPSRERDAKRLAHTMDEMVMRPIRKLLDGARQLLLSPDGNLNLIPFAALIDENNHYLIENYSISYLTSGRDLLRLQVARESKSNPLVIADPIYGEKPDVRTVAAQPIESGNDNLLANINFAPLLTGAEADAIKLLMPDSEVLKRDKATETAVKKARAPRILHIATHGFFLQSHDPGAENSRGFSVLGLPATRSGVGSDAMIGRIENPLMRSGLALAWANQRKSADDDGILTAAEVAGLDLWGTKLVVLSACDTGIGEVKNGEGVYGMRRALVLAGAESQVLSLWKVNDAATKDLMIAYYTALKQGEGRAEALRNVQLHMLRDPRRRHPYYWASFIHSGEWANLDGKR